MGGIHLPPYTVSAPAFCSMLSFLDFVFDSAELVEFKVESSGIQPLIDWIVAYFSSISLSQMKDFNARKHIEAVPQGEAVRITERMPIILQHQGHSRTIVGYEVTKKGEVNLLTFDPSRYLPSCLFTNLSLLYHILTLVRVTESRKHPCIEQRYLYGAVSPMATLTHLLRRGTTLPQSIAVSVISSALPPWPYRIKSGSLRLNHLPSDESGHDKIALCLSHREQTRSTQGGNHQHTGQDRVT